MIGKKSLVKYKTFPLKTRMTNTGKPYLSFTDLFIAPDLPERTSFLLLFDVCSSK